MRAALYCRVSTSDQDCTLQSIALLEYVRVRGWTAARIEEEKISGAKLKRPGLSAILEAAGRREIDVVLVTKLDRFGRSAPDLLANLKELEAAGVRFIAIEQGIDTDESKPMSRFFIQILAAVAEFERELIRDRQRAGIANRRNKGLLMGRMPKVFRRDLARDLRAKGCSIRHIARELKVPPSTIHDFLASDRVVPVWPFDPNGKDGIARDSEGSSTA